MSKPNQASIDVIKRPHIGPVNWSETELLELMGCVEDPLYFMSSFMKVQHPIKGALPFIPYPFQFRIIDAFHRNRFCIALTGRQLGKCVTSNTNVLVNENTKEIGSLVKLSLRQKMIDCLENWLLKLSL